MANITIPNDFLESDLRQEVLYELVMSLGFEISETAFRSIITQLNLKFVSPRVAFSSLWSPKQLTVYYSTSDQFPTISQQKIVSALMDGFGDYSPSILYEKSPGEVPEAIPLIPVKATEPRPLFSPEWLEEGAKDAWKNIKQGWEELVETVSEKTGLPEWVIPYVIGGSTLTIVLFIVWLKTKPVVVIKTKES